jgi:hypothetical protein
MPKAVFKKAAFAKRKFLEKTSPKAAFAKSRAKTLGSLKATRRKEVFRKNFTKRKFLEKTSLKYSAK